MSVRARSRLRWAALLACAVLAVLSIRAPRPASGQQLGEGMERTGTVGIQNETERQLFSALICMCGCPREALSTCTCGYAHERRAELRGELSQGRSIEEIKATYATRFGLHALVVPPNVGANKLLWAVPLVAIVAGAAFVITTLRRWRNKGAEASGSNVGTSPKDANSDSGGDRHGADSSGGKRGRKRVAGKQPSDAAAPSPPKHDAYDDKLDDELRALDE